MLLLSGCLFVVRGIVGIFDVRVVLLIDDVLFLIVKLKMGGVIFFFLGRWWGVVKKLGNFFIGGVGDNGMFRVLF